MPFHCEHICPQFVSALADPNEATLKSLLRIV